MVLNTVLDAQNVVSSFFFLPSASLPILQPGWTLNFEMLFYLLFAVFMVFRRRPIIWLSILLSALTLVGLTGSVHSPWGWEVCSPLLMEFVFGMWIGFAAHKKKSPTNGSGNFLRPCFVGCNRS